MCCRGTLATRHPEDSAVQETVVDEAWGIYGARFQLPEAADRVLDLLRQTLNAVPQIRSKKADVTHQKMLSATLADLPVNVQRAPAEVAMLADSEAKELQRSHPEQASRLPQGLFFLAAALHAEVAKLCSSSQFIQQNGLYSGQNAWLKQWLR